MPKLPAVSGRQLIQALQKDGFEIARKKGSHVTLKKGKNHTVVPLHRDLSKGTLLGILKQCGLSKDDLIHLLS
jgi:predicted RNA binding protein YcfA (HicA-like mRNA interferase family)